ncbi:hypothetical protein L2E82_28579 [Cichorium intybus]|uniref:Uncharacterized protein n=1 Tax=Cichorium intybus TaxID=13427 RepID=A0ACB9CW64_CICIN|nr:hypothetical protein L2E82_28579 [Cichorium intybus]
MLAIGKRSDDLANSSVTLINSELEFVEVASLLDILELVSSYEPSSFKIESLILLKSLVLSGINNLMSQEDGSLMPLLFELAFDLAKGVVSLTYDR